VAHLGGDRRRPCCGTISSSPSASKKARFFASTVGGVEVDGDAGAGRRSPLPAEVTRPSTKSVGSAGIGSGSQRRRLGVGWASSNGPERSSLAPS
jgi:hypothetical protein